MKNEKEKVGRELCSSTFFVLSTFFVYIDDVIKERSHINVSHKFIYLRRLND